jgi:DNA mismatch repair protein MutS2
MSIAEQTLETLEFPKIRARLAQHTSFAASRELALALSPATERDDVAWRLRLTSEARRLLDEYPQATIGGARDVREAARHAARGGTLEGAAFLEIANTLRGTRRLRALLLKLDPEIYPLLVDLAEALPQVPALEEEIERTIGEDGEVLDSASPALRQLRREVMSASSRLQERLHQMVTSSQYAGVLQEALVTVRDGRYVVPVRADKRRDLPGLVHDQSASGATLYIEPMAVVDLNNRWREAQLAEREEVQRILAALSGRVGGAASELVDMVETLALLDLFFAQARYALALRCVAPQIVEPGALAAPADATQSLSTVAGGSDPTAPLLLTAARHPLLNQDTVVPIDIWLGGEFQLLLITGPNTGGKTVALKTVGLLALMAQAGLHIPARDPCRLPLLRDVFADIGDEQSIEQSLSTFSSHMTNIIRILRAIDENERDEAGAVLVLLDELGAGTDPVEGAALARAISGRLLERGCLGVCTTHYAELKAFAHNTPGVQNASVEFDVETLAPTYRLTIGLPGRSNALAIASRLGLDSELVQVAQGTISGEEMQLEGLLANIHREREAVAEALQRAEAIRADAEKYRERYTEALQELEDEMQARIDEANQQLEAELRAARAEFRKPRGEAPGAELSRRWAQEAEQRLREMQSRVQQTGRAVLGAHAPEQAAAPGADAPRPLKVGDSVLVRSLGLQGEILAIDEEDETADVQVGGFRVQAGLNELRRDKGGPREKARQSAPNKSEPEKSTPLERPAPTRSVSVPPPPEVPLSFDMRGWRAADVSERLDRYLNDAYLADLPVVRLIHGKGSGVLRQVVRDMLRDHPLVRSFEGGGAEGGEGVTVATFARK